MRRSMTFYFLLLLSTLLLFTGTSCEQEVVEFREVIYSKGDDTQITGDVPVEPTTYKIGDTVTIAGNSGNLSKPGHHFVGWNTQQDGSGQTYYYGEIFTLSRSPFNDLSPLVLYPVWHYSGYFKINFHANGADSGAVPTDNSTYQIGTTTTLPDNTGSMTKEGFVFKGWTTTSDGDGAYYPAGAQYTIPNTTTDINLYAVWAEPRQFRYDTNGADSSILPTDSISFTMFDEIDIRGSSAEISREGYNFHSWNTEPDGSGTTILPGENQTLPDQDLVLYAQWQRIYYTISYDSVYGSEISSQTVAHGEYVPEPEDPTREYYTFAGWYWDRDYQIPWEFSNWIVVSSFTLYAKWESNYPASFAGGSGTQYDPYQVSDAAELYAVRYYPDKHYIQTADIDLSEFSSGKGWEPIGETDGDGYADSAYFSGSFNGNGYTISNLYVNRPEKGRTGLFGYVNFPFASGNSISNVNLQNVFILGSISAGGLVGEIVNGTISNCTVNNVEIRGTENIGGLIGKSFASSITHNIISEIMIGMVQSSQKGFRVGGLAGSLENATVSYSKTEGFAIIGWRDIGGLVGSQDGGVIEKSLSLVSHVEGKPNYSANSSSGEITTVGGLIGSTTNGLVQECYSESDVTGYVLVGGLIGYSSGRSLIIRNCFTTGDVNSIGTKGGLVGFLSDGTLSQSYAQNTVTPNTYGGLVGGRINFPTIVDSYYDATVSGIVEYDRGIPISSEQMSTQSTFIGWDFANTWIMGPSFPVLRALIPLY